jgi:putative aldouronate transport system substrate-binding protein
MRRATALAAAATLAAGLSACSGSADGGDEAAADLDDNKVGAMEDYQVGDTFKATEPLTFPILYSDHPNYPIQDDWLFWSALTERTGVTLDPVVVPMSDYEEKRSLLIGAGDAPAIIPKTYPGSENPFVSSGAILPVSDYVDLMPHFQDKVRKWNMEADLDTLRQQDGKFYVLPGLHEEVWRDYSLAIRTDVLDELGLEMPRTWDELHDVLAAMKKAYPDTYPLSDRFMGKSILNVAAVNFGTSAGWGYPGNSATFDRDKNEFVFTGATEEYRDLVEYFHTLVAEGLMDPESFTQDDDAAVQKFVTGKSFVISTNAQTLVNEYRPGLEANIPGATVKKMVIPSGPAGAVKDGSRLENGIMISADAVERDDFVAMMQFIDWLWYSDEGQEFAKWGVEGTTYTKDASGKRTLAENIDFVGLNPGAPEHLQKDYGFSGGVFAYGGSTELLYSMFSDEEIEFLKAMEKKKPLPLAPPHPMSEADREQATLLESPLTDAVTQATLQFILGQRDMSEWDAYTQQLEGLGATRFIELVNTAYEEYQSKNG